MKREILNIINEQGTIFKNKCVFQMGYVPEIWKFREREFGLMATYCRSLTENIAPQHLLITGDYATGKTTTLKSVVGILNFDEGEILVDGISIKDDPIGAKKVMAYINNTVSR